jgi:hypothetical protein
MRLLRACGILGCALICATQIVMSQGPGSVQGGSPAAQGRGAAGGQGRGGTPPRDTREQPAGTAVIRGRVVSAESGSPVRRAQVRLSSSEARENRLSSTDEEGGYEFRGLTGGRYTLSVSKGGFITLQYGQRRPLEAAKPLELAAGQMLDRVDFVLPRGSVIGGRIADEYGEPISDVVVQAMRLQFVSGQRRLVNAGRMVSTDDLGQFRIFGLPPGTYLVSATVRNAGMGPNVEEASGFAPTYYPGTASPTDAQKIPLSLGQELTGVNFSLIPARLSRVAGTVVDSQGQALGGVVVLVRPATGLGGPATMMNIGGGGQTRADGGFTLTNVPPGEYVLEARTRPREVMSGGTEVESGSASIVVHGEDVNGVTIITTKGVTVSGRVSFEGSAQGSQQNLPSRASLQVVASSITPDVLPMGRMAGDGRVAENGSFELRSVSGPRLIRVSNVPSGWTLRSVTLNGADITDTPYDFRGEGRISGLEILLTNRLTDVTGEVKGERDAPVRDYVVLVFSDESAQWGFQSRFIRTAHSNQDGRFEIKGLPPGHYLGVALESLEQDAEGDPDLLEQLRQSATRFSLTEAQPVTLALGLTAGP